MIHTAQFYLILNSQEVFKIEDMYKETISMVEYIVNKKYDFLKLHLEKKFGGVYVDIIFDVIKMLKTANITEKDYVDINYKMYTVLYEVLGVNNKQLTLIRLDYRYDVVIKDEAIRRELFKIYSKTIDKHYFKSKGKMYETTVKYESKSVELIVYDKEAERKAKGKNIERYEKNVLRFEVKLRNKHLNYIKRQYNLEKTLETFMKDAIYKRYIINNFKDIFYSSNYYNKCKSREIILKSSLKQRDKEFLKEFLDDISKLGVTKVKQFKLEDKNIKYSKYKFNKAIKLLGTLDINPILISSNDIDFIENPIKIFYSDDIIS